METPIAVRELTGNIRWFRRRNYEEINKNKDNVGFLETHSLQQQYRCKSLDSQYISYEWKDISIASADDSLVPIISGQPKK